MTGWRNKMKPHTFSLPRTRTEHNERGNCKPTTGTFRNDKNRSKKNNKRGDRKK